MSVVHDDNRVHCICTCAWAVYMGSTAPAAWLRFAEAHLLTESVGLELLVTQEVESGWELRTRLAGHLGSP
jgi:hypothetical protein